MLVLVSVVACEAAHTALAEVVGDAIDAGGVKSRCR